MTPKSLLRAEAAKSRAEEFTGAFQPVLTGPTPPAAPTRALLCSGKIAVELLEHRRKLGDEASAVIRLERLYPFPKDELAAALRSFETLQELRWVQEEPANMGAWSFISPRLREAVPELALSYVGRCESASPATGSQRIHQTEQDTLLTAAFQRSN
jgi:2-oxoglutarate dehydrogenase E1 component